MGFAARLAIATLVLALLSPSGFALSGSVPTPAAPAVPTDQPLELEQIVYNVLESLDGASRAPCAAMRLMPSDTDFEVTPFVSPQSLGVEANGGLAPSVAGPLGTYLIFVAYPSSCVAWAQEQLSGETQTPESILRQVLP